MTTSSQASIFHPSRNSEFEYDGRGAGKYAKPLTGEVKVDLNRFQSVEDQPRSRSRAMPGRRTA